MFSLNDNSHPFHGVYGVADVSSLREACAKHNTCLVAVCRDSPRQWQRR